MALEHLKEHTKEDIDFFNVPFRPFMHLKESSLYHFLRRMLVIDSIIKTFCV